MRQCPMAHSTHTRASCQSLWTIKPHACRQHFRQLRADTLPSSSHAFACSSSSNGSGQQQPQHHQHRAVHASAINLPTGPRADDKLFDMDMLDSFDASSCGMSDDMEDVRCAMMRSVERIDALLGGDDEGPYDGLPSGSGSAAADNDSQASAEGRGSSRRQAVLSMMAAVPHEAPKVRPLYVYLIYYIYISIFLTHSTLDVTQGSFASEALEDSIINDHAALLTGEVWRVLTAGFFCDGAVQLFINLAALSTLGNELESLLGYGSFWAVYWVTSMAGNLVDALISESPVTYGPANSVAGMVGAMVAYLVLNQGLDEQLHIAGKKVRQQMMTLAGWATKAQEEQEETLVKGEVTVFLGVKLSAQLSVRARGALVVLAALLEGFQGLVDIASSYPSSSVYGMAASFWTGIFLAVMAAPRYKVEYCKKIFSDDIAAADDASAPRSLDTSGSASSSSSTVTPLLSSTSVSKASIDASSTSNRSTSNSTSSSSSTPDDSDTYSSDGIFSEGDKSVLLQLLGLQIIKEEAVQRLAKQSGQAVKVVDQLDPRRRTAAFAGSVAGLALATATALMMNGATL